MNKIKAMQTLSDVVDIALAESGVNDNYEYTEQIVEAERYIKHTLFEINELEYDATMQAIDNAIDAIAEGTFTDPYADIQVPDKEVIEALLSIQDKLIDLYAG